MSLFENVPRPEVTLYFAKVVLPGVRPVATTVALALDSSLFVTSSACASVGAVVVPFGLASKDMKAEAWPLLPNMAAVRTTSALPDSGIVTVTDGPTVVRFV